MQQGQNEVRYDISVKGVKLTCMAFDVIVDTSIQE